MKSVKVQRRAVKWAVRFLRTQGWGKGFKRNLARLKRALG
jgi:hypothetical protein